MPKSPTDTLRVPPQNIEAEQALLGSILVRQDAINDVIDVVSPYSFYVEKHRLIFETMLEMFAKGSPIDVLSVRSRLEEKNILDRTGGASYLAELAGAVPSSTNAKHYAEIVQKKYLMRSLIEASEHIRGLGFEEESEVEQILDSAEKRLFEVTNVSGKHRFIELKEILGDAWERLDHLHKSRDELRGIPTGFKDLDSLLAGFQKSDLVILAARPSMGKTSLALDIARQTAIQHNVPVGIFSLEMSAQQLVDRMLAAQSHVNAWALRTGRIASSVDFDRIRDALDLLAKAPVYIDDHPGQSIIKMRSVARKLKREKDLKLIIVDYLQLMLTGMKSASDSFYQQVTEISRSLKQLARELDIPVLALSQLSRAVEQRGGKPRLSDLRDSGCLEGNTLVIRADTGKRVPIKELVGQKNVPLLSLDSSYNLRPMLVSRVFASGKKQVFELKSRSGRSIKASGNHPFLTLVGWQRLDALQEGERIALPRQLRIPSHPSSLSRNELILLAHLVGDGCVLPRQPIHYTSADPLNLDVVENAARALFGITPRRIAQKNWWHTYLPSPYRLVRGKHHPIINWFKDLGINPVRSYEKRLPETIFTCSDDDIRFFLHHLWATDGNISWKLLPGRKNTGAIYYSSTSEQLARDVQHLLLRLGVWSTLRTVSQGHHRPSYQIHVQSAPVQKLFLEQVGSYGMRGKVVPDLLKALSAIAPIPNTDALPPQVWNLFVKPAKDSVSASWRDVSKMLDTSYNGSALFASGVSRTRLAKLATVLQNDTLLHLAESDVYWDEIVSISPLGVENVYDLTIPGTHNFVANDFVVHNSIEQDADVVMFIHREDKYKEDSDKPNIAEILVEKHRNGPTGKVELYFDEKKATFMSIEKGDFKDFELPQT